MIETVTTPESSNIEEISYDDVQEELTVTFRKSGQYAYEAVPAFVWRDFSAAPSKGQFLNELIKPNYLARRL